MNSNKHFGEALNELLAKTGITQETLAEEVGIDRSMISHYINDKSVPRINVLLKIANVLKIDPTYFKEYRVHLMQELARSDLNFERECYEHYLKYLDKEEGKEEEGTSKKVLKKSNTA